MNRTLVTLLFALACLGSYLTDRVAAETNVRPYPDPGYRVMGMYRGSLADYYMSQIVGLGDTFPNKKQWWASLKAEHDAGSLSPYGLYCVYFGIGPGHKLEKGLTMEIVKQRFDAWLKPEPGVPTYPELIPAICPSEENVPQHAKMLSETAIYVRQAYGIPVFQWLTNPSPPSPTIAADGWIWDSYFWEPQKYRKHLMKFVSLGKPVNCVFWAANPAWPAYKFPDARALIRSTEDQLRACMEFNVATSAFAVSNPGGSVASWGAAASPDMVELRNYIKMKLAQMHAFKPGDLPLASANFSTRDRSVPVGGDADAPSLYIENFAGFAWIHDANLTGFLDMKLTSEPQARPGLLLARTHADRPVKATLTYRFESYFPLQSVSVQLDAAAPQAANCSNDIAISLNEEHWLLIAEQAGNDAIETMSLNADEQFLKGARTVFVRITMQNDAKQAGAAANRLERLLVKCVQQPPAQGSVVRLVEDAYGSCYYDDDFSTKRWQHLGELHTAHPTHGGYTGSGFWVGMVGGSASSTKLIQRFSAPRQLKQLTVTVRGRVNTKSLGGHLNLGVAPRGGKVQWQTSTDQQPGGIHDTLTLELPPKALQALRHFDVHITLRSTSGIESGEKACASFGSLSIRAQ